MSRINNLIRTILIINKEEGQKYIEQALNQIDAQILPPQQKVNFLHKICNANEEKVLKMVLQDLADCCRSNGMKSSSNKTS